MSVKPEGGAQLTAACRRRRLNDFIHILHRMKITGIIKCLTLTESPRQIRLVGKKQIYAYR